MNPFAFQLKYLCMVAIMLTTISLFVLHKTNPWIQTLSEIPVSSNTIYSSLKLSMLSTTPQCKAAHINKYPHINRKLTEQTPSKYAYIHCIDLNIDITEQMYGILSFHGGLIRIKSKYDHIVLIPQSERQEFKSHPIDSILTILQNDMKYANLKIIPFDSSEIDDAFINNANHKQFRDTFHRAYAFKKIYPLSNYDKLLLLKYNMVILSNNMDVIFNYPLPSAPPQRWSGLQSNIACFLYSVNNINIYEKILTHLRKDVYIWYNDEDNKNRDINENEIKWNVDSFNTEMGTFESLINAIYWKREYGLNGINQIHQKFAINTNKLSNRRTKYFIQHRPNMLYLIEFVDDYPPTKKARDRCIVRSHKMVKNMKLDWFEIAMNTYFVQFWLDFNIICGDADDLCQKLNFKFHEELQASLLYEETLGYPFPYVPQN